MPHSETGQVLNNKNKNRLWFFEDLSGNNATWPNVKPELTIFDDH